MRSLNYILLAAMLLVPKMHYASEIRVSGFEPPEVQRTPLLSNEEFFSKADFIIEGRGIAGHGFAYDVGGNYDPNDFHTSSLFRVSYVHKNTTGVSVSAGDTLRLIRKGGSMFRGTNPWRGEWIYSHGFRTSSGVFVETGEPRLSTSELGIYFFTKNVLPTDSVAQHHAWRNIDGFYQNVIEDSIVKNLNRFVKVNLLQNIEGAFIATSDWVGGATGLNGLDFDNMYELYKYMEQFEGITVPLYDAERMRRHLRYNEDVFNQYLKERNIEWIAPNDPRRIEEFNRRMEIIERNRQEHIERERGLIPMANNVLTVRTRNETVQFRNGRYYFEFDVYVNANNNSTFLDNVLMRFNYNTAAFGTNVANRTTITRTSTFNANAYPNLNVLDVTEDDVSNRLNIGFGVGAVTNPARVRLTTEPVRLFNVRIQVLSNLGGVPSGISFAETTLTFLASLFTPASNTPPQNIQFYNETNYIPPPSFSIISRPPTLSITNNPPPLRPTTARAGVGDTIEINGNFFGTQRGEVLFTRTRDRLSGSTDDFLRGLDAEYIVSWTNNRIEVRVPSFVRRGYWDTDENETLPGHGNSAGTGRVRVRTARNDYVTSPNNASGILNVEYSVRNVSPNLTPDTTPICRVFLARLSDCDDMVFTFHNSFQGLARTSARNAVDTILNRWSRLAGVNFVLERDASGFVYVNNFSDNNRNIIGFMNRLPDGRDFSGMAVVQTARQGTLPANHLVCPRYYRSNGSHIYIQNTTQWNFQTFPGSIPSGVSFYTAFSHEIGHILKLNHVNNSDDLMFYRIDDGNNRVIDLSPASAFVRGARGTADDSRGIIWDWRMTTVGTLGDFRHCFGPGTSVNTPTLTFHTPYPNPTQNSFFIKLENDATIKLYNMLGARVLSQLASGKTEININHLPKGIYNVKILSEDGMIGSSKIVKK